MKAQYDYLDTKNKRMELVSKMMEEILRNQYGIDIDNYGVNKKPLKEILNSVNKMEDRVREAQERFQDEAEDHIDGMYGECTFYPKLDKGSLDLMKKEGNRIRERLASEALELKNKRKKKDQEIKNQYRPIKKKKSKPLDKGRTAGDDKVFYDRIMSWHDRKEKAKQAKIKAILAEEL